MRPVPRKIQLWNVGDNSTDYGVHRWTERSVSEVMARYAKHGVLIPIDIEHSCSPEVLAKRKTDMPPITGGYAAIEICDGAPWLTIAWSKPAFDMIQTRQRLYLSPEYLKDDETQEIVGLIRVSLVHSPGTHGARLILDPFSYPNLVDE